MRDISVLEAFKLRLSNGNAHPFSEKPKSYNSLRDESWKTNFTTARELYVTLISTD